MVTSGVHSAAAAQFTWGAGESVEIKGRRGTETVFPVIARETSEAAAPNGTDDLARQAVADLEGNCEPTT